VASENAEFAIRSSDNVTVQLLVNIIVAPDAVMSLSQFAAVFMSPLAPPIQIAALAVLAAKSITVTATGSTTDFMRFLHFVIS
jgi:hypothetical protein